MSHTRRSVLALAVTAACLLGPAAPASAAGDTTVAPLLLQSNWYWHKAEQAAPVAGLPAVPEPSGVPDGDLPVASTDNAGTPSKLSLIAIDIPKASPGSTVTACVITLTVDDAAQNVTSGPPQLVAEVALRNWPNGKGGEQDVEVAPPLEPKSAVPGKASTDGKTWTFTLPAIAQSWLDDANFGFGIVPAKGYTTPFQLSFRGGKAVKTRLTYAPSGGVPAGGTGAMEGSAVTPAAGTSVPLSLGGPPSSGGLVGGGLGTVLPPALSAAPGDAAPAAPQVAPPGTSPAAQTAALGRPKTVSAGPAVGLVLAALGVTALLALISMVLGAEPAPMSARRPSRLSSVLASRAAGPGEAGARTALS